MQRKDHDRHGPVIEHQGDHYKRTTGGNRIRWFRRLEEANQWARVHTWKAGRLEAQYRRDCLPAREAANAKGSSV